MRFHSLRWRLQVWHAAILCLAIGGFGFFLHAAVRQLRLQEIDAELVAAARVLEGGLRGLPRELLEGRGLDRMRAERESADRPPFEPAQNRRRPDAGFPDERGPADRPPAERRPAGPRPADRGPPPRGPRGADRDGPRAEGMPPHDPRVESLGPDGDRPDPAGAGRRPVPPLPHEHIERALRLSGGLTERYADRETPPYFAIWCRNGALLKSQPEAQPLVRPSVLESPPEPGRDVQYRQSGQIREIMVFGPEETRIVVGRSIERELAALRTLNWQVLAAGLGVLSVGLVGGWFLAGRAVRPIQAISTTAASITASHLSRRVDATRVDDELGELAQILNAMFDRLEQAFERQVRFTADASHELRTPLAIIMSHAELALARQRTPEEYRAALEVALRSSKRMKLLVEELLTLARADAGRLKLEAAPVDLRRIVEDSVTLMARLAEEHEVRVVTQLHPAPVSGDAGRLSQVVANLLANAILYNRPQGTVTISTRVEGPDSLLVVSDTGVGIPQADLPHLFERFYRVDRARSRERGGSGLGLAICQGIVEAHGGSLTVTSQLDVGSSFTVRIPQRAPSTAN
ncbi:MAG: HAMP domain-containing protein [Planctomycetes bacterium]|nr:HAMP domain-containing protein [Planctomycetota bacterium]